MKITTHYTSPGLNEAIACCVNGKVALYALRNVSARWDVYDGLGYATNVSTYANTLEGCRMFLKNMVRNYIYEYAWADNGSMNHKTFAKKLEEYSKTNEALNPDQFFKKLEEYRESLRPHDNEEFSFARTYELAGVDDE